MPHPEQDVRKPISQSRGRRHSEIRRENYEESAAANHRVTVRDDYAGAGADMEAEADTDWSDPVLVDGFECVHAFLKHTAGTATTAVHVAVQAASWSADSADTARDGWYDVNVDLNNDGTLATLGYAFSWTSGIMTVCFRIPRFGRYMRFKVWVDGGTKTNSRAALHVARVMESL